MIDKSTIKNAGFKGWKDYAKSVGQNPSNFHRQLIKKVDQLNHWLSPLNLQIQIDHKGESGERKKRKKRT